MGDSEKYLNAPIMFYSGFIQNTTDCLNAVVNYAVYSHAAKLEHGSLPERVRASIQYFGFNNYDFVEDVIREGSSLYDEYATAPKVGLSFRLFLDYYDDYKTEYEKVCLLGYLALKSIIGRNSYSLVNNMYWFSRMSGYPSTVKDVSQIPDDIRAYMTEYKTTKLKNELCENWNLKQIRSRGFYASFTMSIDDLTHEVVKRQKRYKDNLRKQEYATARAKAMSKLYNDVKPQIKPERVEAVTELQQETSADVIHEATVVNIPEVNFDAFLKQFNEMTGKEHRFLCDTAKQQIIDRLSEGYTKDDIVTAIENVLADPWHKEKKYFQLTPKYITTRAAMDQWASIRSIGRQSADVANKATEHKIPL